jgi:peptidoglycan/xylan/chitin deacetylase (PgdA/CDA1 family)
MNNFGRTWRAIHRISRTRYPRFIFGLPLSADEVPIFTYHDVDAATLTLDLEFLQENGYRTLSLEEYLATRVGKYKSPRRAVLLTFDDARKSFGTVALPLLKSFNARAVLFAPSYWMTPPADRHDDLFLTWGELRHCLDSGLVDVESHAHRHALVATDAQIIDFAHPLALQRFDIYDWPMRQIDGREELGRPALGTPIYRATPLLSAQRRYIENEHITLACRDLVARSGGVAFFQQRNWRRELLRVCRAHAHAHGCWITDSAFRALVSSEFELCRAAFQAHLGYAPRTIAYPWMLGSPRSVELARDAGFSAAFGVALDFGTERRGGGALPVFGRFKCDWLRFLPGDRRANVFGAARRKIAGFAASRHLAH